MELEVGSVEREKVDGYRVASVRCGGYRGITM